MAALDLVKNLYNLLKLLLIMDVVMIHEREVIELFCRIDDFAEEFAALERKDLLPSSAEKKSGPPCCLAYSEIMTIMILFQMIGYRNFKYFYTGFLKTYWGHYFPNLPSYSRFIELMPRALMPLTIFITLNGGRRSGIYYIDSSCLPNCHIKRTKRHRTFKAVAKLGKTSVGWFFGLKLHLVINDIGELIAFKVTPGNHHDLAAGVSLFEGLEGLAFGDKGYIGKAVFEKLLDSGLKLITRKRKNMKNAQPLSDHEQQLLNQRGIIETVFGCLKHKFHIWHTRHRSVANAITHLVAGLAAYIIEPLTITAVKRLPSN